MDPQIIIAQLEETELSQLITAAQTRLDALRSARVAAEHTARIIAALADEESGIECDAFHRARFHEEHAGDGQNDEPGEDDGWEEYGNRYFFSFSVSGESQDTRSVETNVRVSIDYFTHNSFSGQEIRTHTTITILDAMSGNAIKTNQYENLWLEEYCGVERDPNYEDNDPGGSWDNDDPLDLKDFGEHESIVRECTELIKQHTEEIGFSREY